MKKHTKIELLSFDKTKMVVNIHGKKKTMRFNEIEIIKENNNCIINNTYIILKDKFDENYVNDLYKVYLYATERRIK